MSLEHSTLGDDNPAEDKFARECVWLSLVARGSGLISAKSEGWVIPLSVRHRKAGTGVFHLNC